MLVFNKPRSRRHIETSNILGFSSQHKKYPKTYLKAFGFLASDSATKVHVYKTFLYIRQFLKGTNLSNEHKSFLDGILIYRQERIFSPVHALVLS